MGRCFYITVLHLSDINDGKLSTEHFTLHQFYDYLHSKHSPNSEQLKKPAFILKVPENDSFKSQTWKWEDSLQKITDGDLNGITYAILQEYIPQKQPITTYRIVYNAKCPSKAPYGFCRTKTTANKSNKHIVTYAYHDFTYALMSEQAIKPFIQQMASLNTFLKLVN